LYQPKQIRTTNTGLKSAAHRGKIYELFQSIEKKRRKRLALSLARDN
jgi:hypothetical protein